MSPFFWVILKKDLFVIVTFCFQFSGGIQTTFLCFGSWRKRDQKFLEILNSYHPTINFTANYSREKVSNLDVEVTKKRNQLVTNLYIKRIGADQYLNVSSCQVFHSKKSMRYSQALRLNSICSEYSFFDKQCSHLQIWLREKGYSGKLVWKQILKARKFSGTELISNQSKKEN